MENLKWKIGDVEIFQIVEMVDNELFSTFIPEAKPEAVFKYDWLKPHYIGTSGNLKAQVQSFVIKSNDKYILIDTCNGNHKNRPGMPTWGNLNTNFLEKLNNIGIDPDKIDYVACTHLHFDHVGWNTLLENGKWVPTFKNAKYLFSKEEYDYWIKKPENEVEDDHNGIADSVVPVVDAGQAEFVADNHQLDSNISFIPTPGHTPHHVSIVIESNGRKAIISGDVMHHPCQIAETSWTTLADTLPEQTVKTRIDFLKKYANTDTLIIGTHFPYPVAGYIVGENNKYSFIDKFSNDSSNILNLVVKYIDDSFKEKSKHFERTLYWIQQLNPNADLALQVSAYSHDIQRAFAQKEALKKIESSENGFKDEEFLKNHQDEGGRLMYKFLKEHGQSDELAKRVQYLISKHEVGGDEDQNTLKDADSISYFECNADHFVTKYAPILGTEKVKNKFDWMFERITSNQAKQIAEPMYKEALNKLLSQNK